MGGSIEELYKSLDFLINVEYVTGQNINISGGYTIMTKYKNTGIDLFVAENAIIKRPELVELGKHVAIDIGVYLVN
jgi:hypothetical protein